ncbi:hypothetical protein A8990_10148 [Paenibacillus taihuensis]|uniref:DUF1614 domain-containing protein n=1 Tax=Paenibacillus taihuensis TaxID=1156355 RepID=A0A3D9SF48_9BACL|nr:hypothetical protein [Paenibacillus taihuensis]REE94257.1 hypothetical protein A8990_10148 [Paenibacillus taihuensis]
MNDGFIAFWLLSMAAILYMTGWKEHVADGVPHRVIVYFVLFALLLHYVQLPIGDSALITGSATIAVTLAVALLIAMRNIGAMLFVLFSALLTGFMWMWMRYIYSIDPVFIVVSPNWDGPLLAGLFAGLLADRFKTQFILAVMAAVFSVGDQLLSPLAVSKPILIGTATWWDGLVIALCAARLTGNVKHWLKEKTLRMMESRGERGGSA